VLFVVEFDFVLPIILSIVNEFFVFSLLRWWWWWLESVGIVENDGGNNGRGGGGGGRIGKQRFEGDDVAGINGNGNGGNTVGPVDVGRGAWWKHAEWWWWWWWWLRRLKRLRRRKNEPLSNIFSLAGSNVQ